MNFSLRAGRWALLCLAVAGSCSRGSQRVAQGQATPEEALARLAQVGSDSAGLFELLDRDSRWSVMTVHRDLRTLCQLVRTHYPKDRQARELERCRSSEAAAEPRDLFVSQARSWGVLEGLQGLTGKEALQGGGELRTVVRPGASPLSFCRMGSDWAYCGLREKLDRLKIKTARDLASVQENAEAYKGR